MILAFAVSLGLMAGFGRTYARAADMSYAGGTVENKFVAEALTVLEIDSEASVKEADEENFDVAIMKFTLTGEIADSDGNAIANAAELAAKLSESG